MHGLLANSGILPAWFVVPAASIVMIVLAGSITATRRHVTPASRRRIRIANGWVMLLTTPLTAAGFSLIDSQTQPRLFVQVWVLVIGLLAIVIGLALLDMLNTARLARRTRRRLQLSMRLSAAVASSACDSSGDKPDLQLTGERRRRDGGWDG